MKDNSKFGIELLLRYRSEVTQRCGCGGAGSGEVFTCSKYFILWDIVNTQLGSGLGSGLGLGLGSGLELGLGLV